MKRSRLLWTGLSVAGLILLLLWIQGTLFHERVPPEPVPLPSSSGASGWKTVPVAPVLVPEVIELAGTVRPEKVARPAPKVMARILEFRIREGDRVERNDVLVLLDDRDLKARMAQAGSALEAARAGATQASADYERILALHEKEAATQRDLEGARAKSEAAAAAVTRAESALEEASVLEEEARVLAPFDGMVMRTLAEPGDTAVPGRPLLEIIDPHELRFEVNVPERCRPHMLLGKTITIRIESLKSDFPATVEEVAPSADPASRTFLVEASLPQDERLKPGLFGRFLKEVGRKEMILLPGKAVRRSGQVEQVFLSDGKGGRLTRTVKTGKVRPEGVEILSGIKKGDLVLVPVE